MRTFTIAAVAGYAMAVNLEALANQWEDLTEEELYGGMRKGIQGHILYGDLNGDGKTTVSEYLTKLGHPQVAELTEKYKDDYMWWRDGNFLKEAYLPIFNKRKFPNFLNWAEIRDIVVHYGISHHVVRIMNNYAKTNRKKGLTHQEFAVFLHDLFHGTIPNVDQQQPWWVSLSDEALFGGMADWTKQYVMAHDINLDGVPSATEYLLAIQVPQNKINEIIQKHGWDCMWWRSGEFLKDAFRVHFDWNNNYHIGIIEAKSLFQTLGLGDKLDFYMDRYVSEEEKGFKPKELAAFLEDWISDSLRTELPRPFWWAITDAELSESMNPYLWQRLLQLSPETDGRMTAREYLERFGHPDVDGTLQGFDPDLMWWKNGEFMSKALLGLFDASAEHQSAAQLNSALGLMGMNGQGQWVFDRYAQDESAGISKGELVDFARDWAFDTLVQEPIDRNPDWFDMDHDQLYGGLNSEYIDYVRSLDQDGNDRVTLREFLTATGAHDIEAIIGERGEDDMWWKDTHFVSNRLADINDQDKSGQFSPSEFYDVLVSIGQEQNDENIIYNYVKDIYQGASKYEVATILNDWASGTLAIHSPPQPWWMSLSDEDLYSGINGNFQAVVEMFDINGDKRVTLREFLQEIGSQQMYPLIEEYGEDYQWWRDPGFFARALMSVLDHDSSGNFSMPELSYALSPLGLGDKADAIVHNYSASGEDFLTEEEFATFMNEWLYEYLRAGWDENDPWWIDQDGNELFEGLNEEIKGLFAHNDQNNDGKVTIREYLTMMGRSDVEELVDKYGYDFQWWRSADFIAEVLTPIADADNDGHIDQGELGNILASLQIYDTELPELINFNYATDQARGLTLQEFSTFLHDWIIDQVQKDRPDPWWFTETDEFLYGDLSEEIKKFINRIDDNGDGRVSLYTFLEAIGRDDEKWILSEWGWDHMWFKDGWFIAYMMHPVHDYDHTSFINPIELLDVLSYFEMSDPESKLYISYAQEDPSTGLRQHELGELLTDIIYGSVRNDEEYYHWFEMTHDELYGGLRNDIYEIITQADLNGDSFVTARELLKAVGVQNAQDFLNRQGVSDDYQWWRDSEFMRKVFMTAIGQDEYDNINVAEFDQFLGYIQMSGKAQELYDLYSENSNGSFELNPAEVGAFMSDWLHQTIRQREPYWFNQDYDVLYGDLNAGWVNFVLSYDHDGDGKVTLQTLLNMFEHEDTQHLLDMLGWESQWWRNAQASTEIFWRFIDTAMTGFVALPAFQGVASMSGEDDARINELYELYALEDPVMGLSRSEFVTFLDDMIYEKLKPGKTDLFKQSMMQLMDETAKLDEGALQAWTDAETLLVEINNSTNGFESLFM